MDSVLLLVEMMPAKLDAIVQLVRNGLCCVKDLKAGPAFLHDPEVTAEYYKFPEPLDQTTPLELCISMAQSYAFVSVSKSGYRLMTNAGIYKLRRVTRLMEMRANDGMAKSNKTAADRIINESLEREASDAMRCIFVGINVFALGISFFWLVANSFHITSTNWIGGLQGLIHALTVMEIALAPLLYYMLKDGAAHLRRSIRMKDFAKKLSGANGRLGTIKGGEHLLHYETYCWIREGGWSPFWEPGAAFSDAGNSLAEEKALIKEVEKVKNFVDAVLIADAKKSDDKNVKAVLEEIEDAPERIDSKAVETRWEGYLEYLYFVFNSIAFYGYLLGILVFYYNDAELDGTYSGSLRLGYSNEDADWTGNFAGDFMWTVEPVFILSSPSFLSWVKPKKRKIKAD